jgi:hypothetical protein
MQAQWMYCITSTCILAKVSVSCKFSQNLKIMFLSKFYSEKITETLPASSTKKYEQKIFLLYKKNMSV